MSVVGVAGPKSESGIVNIFVSQFQYKFKYIPCIDYTFNYMVSDNTVLCTDSHSQDGNTHPERGKDFFQTVKEETIWKR